MEEELCFSQLQEGTTLSGGKYVIEKKIGEGGFGITYRAMQTELGRVVCIKEFFPSGCCVRDTQSRTIHVQGIGEDVFEKYRTAFVKEAQTLAKLHHPGIVEVIEVFNENNTSYMVMPFIEGCTLQEIVEKQGPLTYPEAVNYMAQVANAMGYVHEHHILHRDIKPDNIIITPDYKAILIDFGSAREFVEDKTQVQTSMLTHGYAPTEQYTRNSRKGAYTDIYAIGATLYFVLTGKVPVEAAARITEPMPEPRELNPSLPEEANRTIMKAMQLKAEDRHQNIKEFMDDLRNIKPSVQPTSPVIPTAPVPPPRSRKKLWLLLLIIAMLVTAGVVYYLQSKNEPVNEEAQAHVEEYNRAVITCKKIIVKDNENEDSLLKARDLLRDVVLPLENKYSHDLPDIYKESRLFQDDLFRKLDTLAERSYLCAENLILSKGDAGDIIKHLELALKLSEKQKYRDDLEQQKEIIDNAFIMKKGQLLSPIDPAMLKTTLIQKSHLDEASGGLTIDLLCEDSSFVRCVYDGIVTTIGYNETLEFYIVIVSHGNYKSVYYNMGNVNVNEGDVVKTGSTLGIVRTKYGSSKLLFQLWNESESEDPYTWIKQ